MTMSHSLNPSAVAPRQTAGVEPLDGSAVRSHQSYEPEVYSVCHHSGQYLTLSETHPRINTWLRAHHDFPGVQVLDDAFALSAHAANHRHRMWSEPGLVGSVCMIVGLVLLALMGRILLLREQLTSSAYDRWLYWGTLAIFAIFSLVLVGNGARLLIWRKTIEHRQARARGRTPATPDFPLLHATYEIDAQEEIEIDLGNEPPTQAMTAPAHGQITIDLTPHEACREHYREYRACYPQPQIGQYLRAGVIALERVGQVTFTQPRAATGIAPGAIIPQTEYEHRVILRAPVPPALAAEAPPTERMRPIRFSVPYTIQPQAFLDMDDEQGQFALSCTPRLDNYNSYTLELFFRWRSVTAQQCFLEECVITIPPQFGAISRVERGRCDVARRQVIWRDLAFKPDGGAVATNGDHPPDLVDQVLSLRVSFEHPLLGEPLEITGTYRCVADALISGMSIAPHRIWDARGLSLRADDQRTTLVINQATIARGKLKVMTRQLSQKHEVSYGKTLAISLAPDNALLEKVLDAFTNCGIELRQIAQAMPRLDPNGTLQTQLHYWDVMGRRYNEDLLDSIDVHVVVTGRDMFARKPVDASLVGAQIEIRARYLYDPRDSTLTEDKQAQPGQRPAEKIPRDVRELTNALERGLRYGIGPEFLLNS